jgi:N-acetylglutamate synthase-like GNAT family acetyltransferase
LSPHEAWFEGLRVDPPYRRHGIARALTNYTRAGCFARGVTVGRAFISADNVASQSLSAKAGFRKVMDFKAYKQTSEVKVGAVHEEVRRATDEDMTQVAEFMKSYAGRMMAWDWHAQEVSQAALERALRDKVLYLVKRDDEVVCVAAVSYWEEEKELDVVSYFCEEAVDLEPLVKHFINEQAMGRVGDFHVFASDEQNVVDLTTMGFTASEHGVSGLWEARF